MNELKVKILTGTQFGCGITALRTLGLLDVIRRSSTATTQCMCLITPFTKGRRALRLETEKCKVQTRSG